MKEKTKVLIIQILLLVIFLILWEILSNTGIINSFIFSSPTRIIKSIITLYSSNNLFTHIYTTLYEIFISFILGILIAFIIAIIMYSNRFLSKVIEPFLSIFNSLPKVALGPMIIIWCGANTKSIITMALLTNIIISILNIYNAFISTDPVKLKLFKSYNASKVQILFKLIIPENISSIINTLKVNMSLTCIGVIMGEYLVSKKGLGYLILYGTQVFNLDLVLAGILLIMVLSYLIYKGINLVDKYLY